MTKSTILIIISLVLYCIQITNAETAKMHIKLVQNNAPSPTLLSSFITVRDDQVTIKSSGLIGWELLLKIKPSMIERPLSQKSLSKKIKFDGSSITLRDNKFASEVFTIIKHFELCHQGSNDMLVSGGTVTKIESNIEGSKKSEEAYYITPDSLKRRANMMENFCRDLQKIVVSNELKEPKSEATALATLKKRSTELATYINAYIEAFAILEKSYHRQTPVDWSKVDNLTSLRPNQGPLEKRKRLVTEAHNILNSFCSKSGLQQTLGNKLLTTDGVILTIRKVRRYRGQFDHTELFGGNIEWGFADELECLGFIYPPSNPAVPVGIIDIGLQRVLLHFLLQELDQPATTYDRFGLTLNGNQWAAIPNKYSWRKEKVSTETEKRLVFLSNSGLLTYLFKGTPPAKLEKLAIINIERIYIENDIWEAGRVDYSLEAKSWVTPFFVNNKKWQAYSPWEARSYFNVGGAINNPDSFRSRKELAKPAIIEVK